MSRNPNKQREIKVIQGELNAAAMTITTEQEYADDLVFDINEVLEKFDGEEIVLRVSRQKEYEPEE